MRSEEERLRGGERDSRRVAKDKSVRKTNGSEIREMTASAMKVVIRKHLVCMSLAVKIGMRRSLVLVGRGGLGR